MTQASEAPGTQSIGRAIRLLKMFSDEQLEWTLTDIVDASGLNKSTVHRLLGALEFEGLLRKTEDGSYRLGSEMIALGGRAMRANQLRRIAHPQLQRLTRQTGETTTLEVLRPNREGMLMALVIDEVLGKHLVGITQYIGSRLPAHATSTGKVLLAWQPADIRRAVLERSLEAYTGETRTHPDQLLAELAEIRQAGVAVVRGELEAGLIATAAPIFDLNGAVQAAISLVGPSVRITPARLGDFTSLVQKTAESISFDMGYRSPEARLT